jgi:hypothetical protein
MAPTWLRQCRPPTPRWYTTCWRLPSIHKTKGLVVVRGRMHLPNRMLYTRTLGRQAGSAVAHGCCSVVNRAAADRAREKISAGIIRNFRDVPFTGWVRNFFSVVRNFYIFKIFHPNRRQSPPNTLTLIHV